MNRHIKFLFVVFLVVAAVVPVHAARGGEETVTIDEDAERIAFRLANNARSKKGLRRLELNSIVRREARNHSEDMAEDEEVSTDGLGERFERILRDDGGIDDRRKVCAIVTRVSGSSLDAPRQIFRKFKEENGGRQCLFDRSGYSTQSGAVGVAEFNGRRYATFIAAHGTST